MHSFVCGSRFACAAYLQVSERYARQLDEQELPVEEEMLDARHDGALANALQQFDAEKFGNEEGASASSLREVLRRQIEQARRHLLPAKQIPPLKGSNILLSWGFWLELCTRHTICLRKEHNASDTGNQEDGEHASFSCKVSGS